MLRGFLRNACLYLGIIVMMVMIVKSDACKHNAQIAPADVPVRNHTHETLMKEKIAVTYDRDFPISEHDSLVITVRLLLDTFAEGTFAVKTKQSLIGVVFRGKNWKVFPDNKPSSNIQVTQYQPWKNTATPMRLALRFNRLLDKDILAFYFYEGTDNYFFDTVAIYKNETSPYLITQTEMRIIPSNQNEMLQPIRPAQEDIISLDNEFSKINHKQQVVKRYSLRNGVLIISVLLVVLTLSIIVYMNYHGNNNNNNSSNKSRPTSGRYPTYGANNSMPILSFSKEIKFNDAHATSLDMPAIGFNIPEVSLGKSDGIASYFGAQQTDYNQHFSTNNNTNNNNPPVANNRRSNFPAFSNTTNQSRFNINAPLNTHTNLDQTVFQSSRY